MGYIYRKSGKKFFLLKGDLIRQSEANHEHRGDIANELEERPELLKQKASQIVSFFSDGLDMLRRRKAFKKAGCTFYVTADYSIMLSVVAGTGHPIIYGGPVKVYKTVKGVLSYFLKRCETFQLLEKKEKKLLRMLVEAKGHANNIAIQFGIRKEFIHQYINENVVSHKQLLQNGSVKKDKIPSYAICVLEMLPQEIKIN